MPITHIRQFARRAACALALVAAAAVVPASASAAVPSTNCQVLDPGVCRAEPFFPDGNPLAASRLGSTGSPEDDLAQALEDLGAAADAGAAAKARGRALAILEGDASALVAGDEGFLERKAYNGIPLLNWNVPAKVRTVAAGGVVDVREVRFGDHALLDTWMLKFADPAAAYKIRWHVTELGTSFGGELSPAAVPVAGATGHAVVEPLALPSLTTGVDAHNRFHPGGAPEDTRLATQTFTVDMPAPASTNVILDPNLKPGHETFAQMTTDRGDRLAAAEAAFGFAGDAPTAGQKAVAIGRLAHASPEWQVWDALQRADPSAPEVTLDAAKSAGTNTRILVSAMRSRDTLPAPSSADATAAVNVEFANGEAYVSRRDLRLAPDTSPDGAVKLSVTNLDGFAHTFSARQMHGRDPVFGVLNWGRFTTDELGSVSVPAGETRSLTVTPAADAFSLWVGDTELGDQSGMAVALERGPRRESLALGSGGTLPLHQTMDQSGRVWVTMEGSDELVRLSPTDGAISAAAPERFPLPGGISDPQHLPPPDRPAEAALGPADVAVDGQGIVWATLTVGNGIARIDPTKAQPGSTAGITIYKLAPCEPVACRMPPGEVIPGPLSRNPLQMRLYEDGGGNTVIFFTEMLADRIGLLRVSATGERLNETHYTCGCQQPLGISLDAQGNVWFSEGANNRLGRMTLDQTRPYSGTSQTIDHFNIPSFVEEFVPGQPLCPAPGATTCEPPAVPNPMRTSLPHSVAVDRNNRVWFTEEAAEKVGYLDIASARPGTTNGFHETDGPVNDFERSLAPADVTVDRAGKAYFSDEYGDQIASATVRADGSIAAQSAFRPATRNSLTDAPMVDDKGNLWFIESGSNLITRISGVTAGLPRPARAPLITANTSSGAVAGDGLREMSSVDLRLFRGATMVTQRTGVAVSAQGTFSASLPLAADDRLEIVPRGANAPAPFSFRVARLTASVASGGAVTGRALVDNKALSDAVTITAGATSATVRVAAADGAYSWSSSLSPATGAGTVSFTAATVSARFRTVTPFGPPAAPGGAGAGGGTGVTPAPATPASPAPASPAAAPSAATPSAAVPGNPAATPVAKPAASAAPGAAADYAEVPACSRTRWMQRSGSGKGAARAIPLLGLTAKDAQKCLGRPSRRTRSGRTERWTYAGVVELRVTSGRVTAFTLLGGRLRSAPDRAAVGAPVSRLRTALGALVRDGKGYRGLVAMGRAGYADIRVTVNRSSRVSRVTVSLKQRSALDRTARRLLGKTR
jgi:streptogramin lyase